MSHNNYQCLLYHIRLLNRVIGLSYSLKSSIPIQVQLYENIFAITNTIFCLLLSNVLYGIYKRSSVMDHDEVMPLERNEAIEKCLQERQPLDLQNVLL